jgi:hypothetical protein
LAPFCSAALSVSFAVGNKSHATPPSEATAEDVQEKKQNAAHRARRVRLMVLLALARRLSG